MRKDVRGSRHGPLLVRKIGGRRRTRTYDPLIKSPTTSNPINAHSDTFFFRSRIEPKGKLKNVGTHCCK